MNIWRDLHFDKGVRVAVGVHGSQMGTAYDTNQQAAFLCVIAQWHQDAATLGTQKTTVSDTTPVSTLTFPYSMNASSGESCSTVYLKFLKKLFTVKKQKQNED